MKCFTHLWKWSSRPSEKHELHFPKHPISDTYICFITWSISTLCSLPRNIVWKSSHAFVLNLTRWTVFINCSCNHFRSLSSTTAAAAAAVAVVVAAAATEVAAAAAARYLIINTYMRERGWLPDWHQDFVSSFLFWIWSWKMSRWQAQTFLINYSSGKIGHRGLIKLFHCT